jgi:hypothetical protein
MMDKLNLLRAKASALGFSMERGLKKGAGYVLVDANGDKPLGTDYTAALDDIERFLNDFADDAGIDDVETSSDEPSKPPPTKAEVRKSLADHPDAGEIKEVLEPPPSTREEQRQRLALDHLFRTGATGRSAMAFERLSEAEKEEFFAKLQAAIEDEEKRKTAKLPTPVMPIRDIGINPDHPLAQERARQGRAFNEANQRLKTNLASLKDYDAEKYRRDAFENGLLTPEQIWEAEREKAKDFVPPKAGAPYATPRPATEVTVVSKKRRVSKADRPIRRRLLQLRGAIRDAVARKDKAGAGTLLREAKDLLGHGPFIDWVEREIGVSVRSAQRYLEAAKAS